MEVKEWLDQVFTVDKELKALNELRQKSFSLATKTTSSMNSEGLSSSSSNSKEDAVIKYISVANEIEQKIKELASLKCDIYFAISQINDATLRTVLIYRYIELKKWKDIEKLMSYSERQLNRLHSKALYQIKPKGEHYCSPR